MIEKIKSRYNRSEDMKRFIREAEQMIEKYGWEGRKTHPYSYPMTVEEILSHLKDYDICTSGSQEYLICLANGFADILNGWEHNALQPKVTIRINGKDLTDISEEFARDLVESGIAEYV